MDAPAGPPWLRLPAALGPVLAARAGSTADAVALAVARAVPVLAGGDKQARDLQAAVGTALDRLAALPGTDAPALPAPVREVFVALGAAEAREDRGPDPLLAALRTASRVLLRSSAQALADVGAGDVATLVDLADAVATFTDEVTAACTDGFARQVRELAGERDRARRALAELLVRGTGTPEAVRAAAQAAGWGDPDAVVPVLLPADRARDARFRFPDGVVLDREDDAVLLLPGRRAGRAWLDAALREGSAVGPAAVGPALAWPRLPDALRLVERLGRPASGVVHAEDRLLELALGGDPTALEVLAARRLAPLAGVPAGRRDALLATLASWLRHWGSRADVAAELFVHPQTVSYRVRRLRELLGPALDDPAARVELLVVLAAGASPDGAGRAATGRVIG